MIVHRRKWENSIFRGSSRPSKMNLQSKWVYSSLVSLRILTIKFQKHMGLQEDQRTVMDVASTEDFGNIWSRRKMPAKQQVGKVDEGTRGGQKMGSENPNIRWRISMREHSPWVRSNKIEFGSLLFVGKGLGIGNLWLFQFLFFLR